MRDDRTLKRKTFGTHYTPKVLADFISKKISEEWSRKGKKGRIRLLDPAVGDGELLASMLSALKDHDAGIDVFGFDTDLRALRTAGNRLRAAHPRFTHADFLAFTLKSYRAIKSLEQFDIVIANPPYVRTQVMGADRSRMLAREFRLAGRIDLYQAFIQAIARVLKPGGIAGLIVSNRFMATNAGASVRKSILENFNVSQVWDLGDTRLFEAAVLPSILIMEKKKGQNVNEETGFTSIYSIKNGVASATANNSIQAMSKTGIIRIKGGGLFHVRHGFLDHGNTTTGIWRLADEKIQRWLAIVNKNSTCTFKDIGKIRVGVKTCADKVFIRRDWDALSEAEMPELLFPLTTHDVARRYKALHQSKYRILYPHIAHDGRRVAIELGLYPRTAAYLDQYREQLEKRKYIIKAGRHWYEIWVPQEPDLWNHPKLVFRDISEKPTFWMDLDGSIVNGDCYWLVCENNCSPELLWLALGVANSSFMAEYYDINFPNRLYAGRRRYIKQYVERFPLPDPNSVQAQRIGKMARDVFDLTDQTDTAEIEKELDRLVRKSFGI
jgi:methylase of polypeptide subunit release factors